MHPYLQNVRKTAQDNNFMAINNNSGDLEKHMKLKAKMALSSLGRDDELQG